MPLVGNFRLNTGRRNGNADDHGRYQLHTLSRDIQPKGNGHKETIEASTQDRPKDTAHHAALSHQRLADDQRSKGDGDHTSTQVNIAALLILGQDSARQSGKGTGNAKAHGNGKGRIHRGSFDHIRAVAGGTNGKTKPGFQETCKQQGHQNYNQRRKDQFIPAAQGQRFLHHGKDGITFEYTHRGGKTHDRQIDGVKARIDNDTSQNTLYAKAGLEGSRNITGNNAGQHGGKQSQNRMTQQRYLAAYRTAKGKTSVCRKIRNIQDRIAYKQGDRHKGVDTAKLKGCLYRPQGKNR